MKYKILVVDDEDIIRDSLSFVLKDEGYDVSQAKNGREAYESVTKENYDVVITDIEMPEMNGMELLEKISEVSPQTFVIIITAFASIETAIKSLRKGAYDYIIKPIEFDEIIFKIKRLVVHKQLSLENQLLRQELNKTYDFNNIIGQSQPMKDVFKIIEKVASTDSNILITGKSGTGKELVARAIHYNSQRKAGRFVPVNCGAVVESLFESELFGHKKGAFTGAIRDKDGLFKIADDGSLFLDEIGEFPHMLQVKLLRAIEQKEITPVGGTDPIKVDTRIIAATNRDLSKEIEKGSFREDLFYRLNVVEIKLPPLSERPEDIPLLVKHFINKYKIEMNKNIQGVDNEAMRVLMKYNWKGEVRELENVIERAVIFCEGDFITVSNLPQMMLNESTNISDKVPRNLKDALRVYERKHIIDELRLSNNNKEKTAETLGISLSSLYRKIEELGIEK
jgi:two-component system response regulator PilR (NtrC family)